MAREAERREVKTVALDRLAFYEASKGAAVARTSEISS
jgi:hypothetical protein